MKLILERLRSLRICGDLVVHLQHAIGKCIAPDNTHSTLRQHLNQILPLLVVRQMRVGRHILLELPPDHVLRLHTC